jgi:hypothetical protein
VLNVANVTNVEEIVYRTTAGSGTIDMANFTGATKLTLDRSIGASDISNLGLAQELFLLDGGATLNTTAIQSCGCYRHS